MNTWKPTNGLKRAEPIVRQLEADYHAVALSVHAATFCHDPTKETVLFEPEFRHRMVAVIAEALDQALRDGSEMDALEAVVGTFKTGPNGSFKITPIPDGVWTPVKPDESIGETVARTEAVLAKAEAAAPKKRGRGRPNGSTKAKKAKPQAEPTEMQP